jgi:hypothetical protein
LADAAAGMAVAPIGLAAAGMIAVLVMGSLALAVETTRLQANRAIRLRMGFQEMGYPCFIGRPGRKLESARREIRRAGRIDKLSG